MSQVKTFLTCAKQAAKGYTNVRYFLATDNPKVQSSARSHFGDQVFWVSDLNSTVSGMGIRYRDDLMRDALVDVFLLADCDEFVVTQASSFGRMGFATAEKRPWFVTFDSVIWNRRKYPPSQCRRSETSKPCADRNHNLVFRTRSASCLTKEDKDEAFKECDMS